MQTLAALAGWLFLIVMILLVQPFIIYCLWDDVMVKFFNLQDVTFLDSVWISILASVLFKSSTSAKSE